MSKPKMSRNALKAVIKECLMEILSEGIGPSNNSRKAPTKKRRAPTKRRSSSQPTNPAFNEAVSRSTSALTSDPVMAAIFEDTARSTLQEQRESPSAMANIPSPNSEDEVPGKPEDLFEGSSNWAHLAFAEKKPV